MPLSLSPKSPMLKQALLLAAGTAALTVVTSPVARAQAPVTSPPPEQLKKEAAYLKEVKVPDGFDLTLFSSPPQSNYPVFVASSVDGTVYVSSDKNGSLDRAPKRGSIIRLRDTDGDGRADESKAFVPDVDSPRGLVWDHDRVYVMHPPHLSAFIDHNGDGVADEQKVLVKNIAFGFKDRPADHTSNGVTLGIDGWLYLAIGDFGFMEAEGTDGKKLQFRSGGVVRVRPDGTDLQVFSKGTRNILEVAISPTMEAFSRDNTNDGGGWDIRFHHFTGLEHHGYPSLYMNFNDEAVQPLADYGGGSGCGAAWLAEPGFPPGYQNVPLTADWGKEWIYRHEVTPKGSTFTDKAHEFLKAPRVTDLDVDGSSHIYAASWKGASFTYVGEDVGFLVRVTPKGYQAPPMPDFEKLPDLELVKLLSDASSRRSLEAQRTLLRRPVKAETTAALQTLAADASAALAARTAALFALKQSLGEQSSVFIASLTKDAAIRALAIRALGDRGGVSPVEATAAVLAGLKDELPRVRLESEIAMARLNLKAEAAAVTPLLADADAVVVHTAVRSLILLEAADAALAVVDTPGTTDPRRAGALRVLQALHTKPVVDALLQRLAAEQDSARRRGLLSALCRLYYTDGVWKGDSWGTRPDTSGPYYQTAVWSESPAIQQALRGVLKQASTEEATFLLNEMSRHKLQDDAALAQAISMAAKDPSLVPVAVNQLLRSSSLPAEGIPLLIAAAADPKSADPVRLQAITALARTDSAEGVAASLTGLPKFKDRDQRGKAAEAMLGTAKLENHHTLLEKAAEKLDGGPSLWADAGLLTLANAKSGSPEARQLSQAALDKGWTDPARRVQILQAVVRTRQRSWADRVIFALKDTDSAVAAAAKEAVKALKLDPSAAAGPLLETMDTAAILAALKDAKGDAAVGQQIFLQAGCVACHTVSKDEAQRGPFLGNIADTYKRNELAEAILDPNKTLAQGFVTNFFELKDGTSQMGFVTQEAADKVVIRNVAAQEITIPTADIVKREKLPTSLMPPGLMAKFSAKDLASLLDYLQSLAKAAHGA
ncbi:MAG: PVC-type heme-binding CxxCH protein [Verrucomicrobiota bacterium]